MSGQLIHIRKGLPGHNIGNGGLSYSKFESNSGLRNSMFGHDSNSSNLVFCNLGTAISRSNNSPLANCIHNVVVSSSKKKVRWIETRRIVAMMTYVVFWYQESAYHFIGEAMNGNLFSFVNNNPISTFLFFCKRPLNALFWIPGKVYCLFKELFSFAPFGHNPRYHI
jgi:hypothetical protein